MKLVLLWTLFTVFLPPPNISFWCQIELSLFSLSTSFAQMVKPGHWWIVQLICFYILSLACAHLNDRIKHLKQAWADCSPVRPKMSSLRIKGFIWKVWWYWEWGVMMLNTNTDLAIANRSKWIYVQPELFYLLVCWIHQFPEQDKTGFFLKSTLNKYWVICALRSYANFLMKVQSSVAVLPVMPHYCRGCQS